MSYATFAVPHLVSPAKPTLPFLFNVLQDFLPDLSDFSRRLGVHVVLLHNQVTPDAFRRAVDEAYDFHELLSSVPARGGGGGGGGGSQHQGPPQYTELMVRNVPSTSELGGFSVERKLEELAKAWHGRVRHLNAADSTAVLKFESGEKATRAHRNLQGEVLGGRPLQVDFNKRPYFVSVMQQHPALQFQERNARLRRRSEGLRLRRRRRRPAAPSPRRRRRP